MSLTDSQTRLSTMIATDAQGPHAAHLLSRLVVFIDSFDLGVIASVAQDILSPSERRAAFATLRQWDFVRQLRGTNHQKIERLESQMSDDDFFGTLDSQALLDQEIVDERFIITSEAREAIAPDNQAAALHYQHYMVLYRQLDPTECDEHLVEDWPNVSRALDWGYQNRPENMLDFYLIIHSGLVAQLENVLASKLARYACKVAQRTNNAEAQAKLLEALAEQASARARTRSARRYYRMALNVYKTLTNSHVFAQPRLLDILIRLSVILNDYEGARGFYEQMLALYQASRQARLYTNILLRMCELARSFNDLPAAHQYAREVLSRIDVGHRNAFETLSDVGAFYASVDDETNARMCYANAYAVSTGRINADFEILNLWAKFERKRGHIEIAYRLIALTISILRRHIDQWAGSNENTINELYDLLQHQQQELIALSVNECDL